jgi:acrylyl-CoA reductase (NADPH)
VWKRQATDLDRQKLAALTREIYFSGMLEAAAVVLAGQVRSRVVIKIR